VDAGNLSPLKKLNSEIGQKMELRKRGSPGRRGESQQAAKEISKREPRGGRTYSNGAFKTKGGGGRGDEIGNALGQPVFWRRKKRYPQKKRTSEISNVLGGRERGNGRESKRIEEAAKSNNQYNKRGQLSGGYETESRKWG